MWFALSIVALLMLSTRRSAEKKAAAGIDSMAMVWLQQAVALPIIVITLFFAKFYWPAELPVFFWELMVLYVATSALDLYCYFKAITIADISYVAPLLTLFSAGNLVGAYFVLGQKTTASGLVGAALVMLGAYVINLAKKRQKTNLDANKVALILVFISVILRSFYSNIEVKMLRMSNPTSYNFYTSLFTVPFVILVAVLLVRSRRARYAQYWQKVRSGVRANMWPLAIVSITYTLNMLATFQAKLTSPNAAYVGAIKSASVIPVVLIGLFFFKEKVVRLQWLGLAFIVLGLCALALNI